VGEIHVVYIAEGIGHRAQPRPNYAERALRGIFHCRVITLSRFIKPGKSRYERAIYHDAAFTPAPANTLCLGDALALSRVLALGGVLGLSAGHEALARASYLRFVARDTQHRGLDAGGTSV
jgi:hypothetical protein